VVDCVAQERGIDPSVASFDMQMLIGTRGRERTLREWQALFARSDFVLKEVVAVRTFARFIVVRAGW
jgi:C-methyltransferase